MRKYHLFKIQNDYYKRYKNNPKVLYQTLDHILQLKNANAVYGISLYQSICEPFSANLLKNYIQNRFTCSQLTDKVMQVHSITEHTLLQIGYACIIIMTNVNFPELLKVFHIYHKQIFVCDFENKDYFWLSLQIQKRK